MAVTAPFFGRLAGRIGQRRLLIPGGLVWASGGAFLLAFATTTPDYVGTYLPAVLLTGLGVALCLPQLSSAAVQGLPADRFGSGSAVNQAIRNLGATFGVALVVAFTGGAGARRAARRLPPGLVAAGGQRPRRLAAGHPTRTRRRAGPRRGAGGGRRHLARRRDRLISGSPVASTDQMPPLWRLACWN